MYIEFISYNTLLYKQNSDTGQFNINLREKNPDIHKISYIHVHVRRKRIELIYFCRNERSN